MTTAVNHKLKGNLVTWLYSGFMSDRSLISVVNVMLVVWKPAHRLNCVDVDFKHRGLNGDSMGDMEGNERLNMSWKGKLRQKEGME